MSCKVATTVRAFENAATAAFFPRKITDFALREVVASVSTRQCEAKVSYDADAMQRLQGNQRRDLFRAHAR